MLDTLRANSRSVLTYVLFGIIIVVFVVSFGPGSKGCGFKPTAETWAAKVNGNTIPTVDFDQRLSLLRRYYGSRGNLGPEADQTLRAMALDSLIKGELVQQEAHQLGIVVSDEAVSRSVKAREEFQNDGGFDFHQYQRLTTDQFGSPTRYEDLLRHDLAYEQAVALATSPAAVTEEEAKAAWFSDNDRVSLEFVRFPLGLARAEVKAPDEQVKQFLAQNGQRIDQYYKDNAARFDRKKRVHARHILAKVDPKASEAEQKAALQKIEAAAERIKKGEDFARVAEEVSDDPSAKGHGGDLGFFSAGAMAKPFEEAAFKLKPKEISPPVKTNFGWHLIQVLEVQEPEVVSLEKARPEIARDMIENDLARKLATQKAEEFSRKLHGGASLAEAAAKTKLGGQALKVDETGPFAATSSPQVPRIGPAPALFADAMKASAGQALPKVYDSVSGPIVARVKEHQRPDPSTWESEKAMARARLQSQRAAALERSWLELLSNKAKIVKNEALLRNGNARAKAEAPVDEE